MSVDLSSIKSSTSPAPKGSAADVIKAIPVGSLVRVRWVERLDAEEWDQGISIEGENESVIVLEWFPQTSFIDVNGLVAIEFNCLWHGQIFRSSSFCIDEILVKGA